MGILNNWFGPREQPTEARIEPAVDESIGDVQVENRNDVFKAYMPEYLYKPPYGYPRPLNIALTRQLASNPYVYSVIKALADEAASTDWEIVYKDDVESTPELEEIRTKITKFFKNPNGNRESFAHLVRKAVKDLGELDSAVWVKIFNVKGEFSQMMSRDGGYFLKNPDIFGYMGDRVDLVPPMNINYQASDKASYAEELKRYQSYNFRDRAAYFQYGQSPTAMPVPFGKREIVYMMQNPRSNSIYGISPVQILADIVQTLVYGANYNLDFYMNNNMPDGIIEMLGASSKQIDAFRARMSNTARAKDESTGFWRKVFFKIPVSSVPAKFVPFQLDPKTMQVLEQQEWFTKIVWAAFGVTPDQMGFTDNSNKATGENQSAVYKRKAVRPMLMNIKYSLDNEVIPEFGDLAFESFEFKWVNFDLGEEMQKMSLLKMQIDMGVKTPEMVAEELEIDFEKVKKSRDEQAGSLMDATAKPEPKGNFDPKAEKKSILNIDTAFIPYASLKAEVLEEMTKPEGDAELGEKIDEVEEVDDDDEEEEPIESDEFHNTVLEETLLATITHKEELIDEAISNIGLNPLDKV